LFFIFADGKDCSISFSVRNIRGEDLIRLSESELAAVKGGELYEPILPLTARNIDAGTRVINKVKNQMGDKV